MSSPPVPVAKEKKKKSEKRKEKSRDAARSRRSRESEIFTELSEQLPVCHKALTHLDKASLVRLAIGYLKTRSFFPSDKSVNGVTGLYDSLYLPAIDGFLLVVSQDGDMIYLSENVHKYLGISQVDLMGHSIFEYSHPCDHEEVREVLQSKAEEERFGPFSLFVRMKCTLSQKGKSIHMRSAAFRVIHCTGHVKRYVSIKAKESPKNKENSNRCLVSLGEPVPHPSNIEVPLDQQSFISRHSLDMKFTYVDDRMFTVLGYKSEDIMGKSAFLFYHTSDITPLGQSFKTLFSKGQSETGRYRFLAKQGGFAWLLTQATLIYEASSSKPQCVVCVNYVLSGQEKQNEIVSLEQVVADKMPTESVGVTEAEEKEGPEEEKKEEPEEIRLPQANTINIFAPRTADMNKGFLTFVDDDSGRTVMKEEPDDLTHLAPQAGDVCFPLDISYSDLMEDAFLPCSLDEESNLDCLKHSSNYTDSGCCTNDFDLPLITDRSLKSPLTNDPFLCLREEERMGSPDHHSVHIQHSLLKGSDKLLSDIKKSSPSLGSVDISILTSRTDNLDSQDDCLPECTAYIPINDVDDYLLSSTSSLLLDTASPLDTENSNFVAHEDSPLLSSSCPLPIQDKLVKQGRTIISSKNGVKHLRNEIHIDGSSEYPDENDSNAFESQLNTSQQRRPQRLLVNSKHMFSRTICDLPIKRNPPLLYRKQPLLFENSPPEIIDPGEESYLNKNVRENGTGRTSKNPYHLEASVTSIERKQPFPSPPDPPPKRNSSPALLGTLDSPKKLKIDPRLIQNKGSQGSVLLNLLVRGEDASHGYLCPVNQNDHLKYKLLPGAAILDKSLNTQAKTSLPLRPEARITRRTKNLLL